MAENLDVELAELIPNDPECKLDAPVMPLEFIPAIDNPVKSEFILGIPDCPVIPVPIPVFPDFNPTIP